MIFKLIKKYKKRDDDKKQIYWELPALIISLYFAFTGVFFDNLKGALEKKLEVIENYQKANQQIEIVYKPSIYSINDLIENQLEELYRHNSQIFFIRTFNLPSPLVGKENYQDQVIGKRFLGLAFSFRYFITYPPSSEDFTNKENKSRRTQMQNFLFKLLTQEIWNDFSGFKGKYAIHYLPKSRNYNCWSIHSSEQYYCGYIPFSGHWIENSIHPERFSILNAKNREHKEIIAQENLYLLQESINFYESQLNLPIYQREPCMIFFSHFPTHCLRPISIDELAKRIEIWEQKWKIESGSDKPLGLIELENIIDNLIIK